MILFFGSGVEYQKKENGKVVNRNCPSCNTKQRLFEVEKTEYIHVFFIPILKDTASSGSRNIFKCPNCDSVFSISNTSVNTLFNSIKQKTKNSTLIKRWQRNKAEKEIDREFEKLKSKIKNQDLKANE
jgi:hypothetical protein